MMRNKWAAIGIAGALAFGLTACGGDDDDSDATQTNGDESGDAESGDASDAAVVIEGFEFSAQPVSAGSEFSVENLDAAAHTLTADDDSFDVELSGDSSAAVTAPAEPGEYAFHCEIHPQMTGTLVVQ